MPKPLASARNPLWVQHLEPLLFTFTHQPPFTFLLLPTTHLFSLLELPQQTL
uniref:Uncharacterized protein n=1 Tax=Picea glauca TaxID=3330 RepID=A0A101LVX4_PICGL|nr:hypothetical protein ABT39_MTgene1860 [Picea glauca]